MKSTYSLEMVKDYCRNDEEVNATHTALELALDSYQWQYQNASDRQYRDISNSTSKAINTTIEHLISCGFDNLANDILIALEADGETLTKSKFLTNAKKVMKSSLIKTISEARYNKDFALYMKLAFTEHCEEYPLPYAGGHIEGDFEDERKRLEYEDLQEYTPYK